MSLKPTAIHPVPATTAQVARAAFPRGNVYLILRDALGTIFTDADFLDLYPDRGQPGLPPWRLALVTVLQFRENLSDRQAAEAVRARIDWKYLLGLELTDPGFHYSVLSEFRARVSTGAATERFLEKLLTHCQAQGLLRAGGQQRVVSQIFYESSVRLVGVGVTRLERRTVRPAFDPGSPRLPAGLSAAYA
jgi:transposase